MLTRPMTSEVIDGLRGAVEDSCTAPQGKTIGASPAVLTKEITMSNLIHPGPFLRRVLLADAAVSAVVGASMAAGAAPLQGLLGLPVALLELAGLSLFPYAAYLIWIATRRAVPRAAVWVPIALNVVWAADCLFVAFGGAYDPNRIGVGFLALHIVTVLAFAELEFVGLRRVAVTAR